ncbi:MAG: WIAG-tail domain [Alicyclobacillus sp.]|nr:WIAG-tail domain [Alicyclobacillus sp.]
MHLTKEAITTDKLADGAVTDRKLARHSVTADHLVNACVRTEHLALASVTTDHLADGCVSAEKIGFGVVRTSASHLNTDQESGIRTFDFLEEQHRLNVTIQFETPFANEDYVVVAMTNHPDCYAVLKEKALNNATITIVRKTTDMGFHGAIHWIAIGQKR